MGLGGPGLVPALGFSLSLFDEWLGEWRSTSASASANIPGFSQSGGDCEVLANEAKDLLEHACNSYIT